MQASALRLLTALAIIASGIYFGLSLAVYAEADDSPGGVMIGVLLMFGSLAAGLWIALHRTRKPSPHDG